MGICESDVIVVIIVIERASSPRILWGLIFFCRSSSVSLPPWWVLLKVSLQPPTCVTKICLPPMTNSRLAGTLC